MIQVFFNMIDHFLPYMIPDAESLPLYRMVLELACVCVCLGTGRPTIEAEAISTAAGSPG
jgi:hypothetical protein